MNLMYVRRVCERICEYLMIERLLFIMFEWSMIVANERK